MPFNEVRKDYLLDRWVVIATSRGRRPTDFVKKKPEQTRNSACPMCPGNEHMTPPAVLAYLKSGKSITKTADENDFRHKDWLVRAVPNLFPAFSPPQEHEKQEQIMLKDDLARSVGHHEVLIESPNHDEHPADASLPQLTLVVNAYIDRLRELSAKPYVKYVSIFRNHGLEAGASLSHAHSQIIATPIVPTLPREEVQASRAYYKRNGECVFCDIIEKESDGPRFICENGKLVVFAPYASVHPMEFWIVPKQHEATFSGLTGKEAEILAETLKTCLKALKDLVNDPPYNYGFHVALNKDAQDSYHWHLEVYPKLATWAGFELSTGMYINTITPETSAESLRKTINHAR